MNHLRLAATAALLAFLAFTGSASAQTIWRGTTTITKVTPACADSGVVQLRDYRSVFRPRILESDDFKSSLTLLLDYSAVRIARESLSQFQWKASGAYDGQVITGRGGFSTFAGTFKFKTKPAVVQTTTPVATLSGTVNDFIVEGCTVTLKGDYELFVEE